MKKTKVIENFLSLVILRGFDFIVPLITFPYLVRIIGLEKFGLISFASALSIYFGSLIQYGFGITAARDIARSRDNINDLNKIYSRIISTSIVLSLLAFVIFTLIVCTVERFNQYLFLYEASIISVIIQSIFPVWLFQGIEQMRFITHLNLITKAVFLSGLFLLIREESDYFLVPVLYAVSSALSLISAWWIAKNRIGVSFSFSSACVIKNTLVEGRHAFVTQFAPSLYNNTSMFLLGFFGSSSTLGSYSAAIKVIDAVMSLGTILSNVFLPHLSRNLEDHPIYMKIMMISGFFLTLGIAVFSDVISSILFSSNSNEISTYMRILSLWIIFIFIRNATGTNYLMLVGREHIYKNIILYTSVTSAIVGVYLIQKYQAYGAIAVVVGSSFIMAVLTYWYYVQALDKK